MLWDFILFLTIGPLIGFFIYYLAEDRRRSDDFFDHLENESHLVY